MVPLSKRATDTSPRSAVSITTVLQDVRPWGGEACDVHVDGSAIRAIVPVGSPVPDGATAEPGAGRILLPSFSDVHVHLDSTRMGLPYRPRTGGSTLWDRIDGRPGATGAPRARRSPSGPPTRGAGWWRRAPRAPAATPRSTPTAASSGFHGVLAAREAHADRAVARGRRVPAGGAVPRAGRRRAPRRGPVAGRDVVGGIDPCGLDKDPVRHLDTVFALAEKHQAGIDIHLHEEGVLGLFSAGLILDRVAAHGHAAAGSPSRTPRRSRPATPTCPASSPASPSSTSR